MIYANRTVRTFLELQAMNKTNVLLQLNEWHGRTILTIRGDSYPDLRCDPQQRSKGGLT